MSNQSASGFISKRPRREMYANFTFAREWVDDLLFDTLLALGQAFVLWKKISLVNVDKYSCRTFPTAILCQGADMRLGIDR
jgi:hypothetical protein